MRQLGLFLVVYAAVMCWKYVSGDAMTWGASFAMLAGVFVVYMLLRVIGRKLVEKEQ